MRRMRHLIVAIPICLVLLSPTPASAQSAGGNTGFGLGVEAMLAGPAGPALVYQADKFHITAIFAFDTGVDDNFLLSNDEITVGGRFLYQLHSFGDVSDFSVGGGLGIDDDSGGGDDIDIYFEGLAQIRAFIVPNVAIHTSLGVVAESDDEGNDRNLEVALTGQLQAAFGVTYFFF